MLPESFTIEHLFFFNGATENPTCPPERKILVPLCSDTTVDIFERLRTFNPSKEEYALFKETFDEHRTYNDYLSKKDGSRGATLEKIFQKAKWLRHELGEYYLEQIRTDVSHRLSDLIELKIEFQMAFDRLQSETNPPEGEIEPETPPERGTLIRLNRSKQGAKTELLRILDALYERRFFTDENGQVATKESVMKAFGAFLGDDFSAFANSLSQSYNNTSLETNLSIFEQLKTEIQQKCLSKSI